jgi:P4 family phage/plasmid primase-like protien
VAIVQCVLQALVLPVDYPWCGRSRSGAGWHVWLRCTDDLPHDLSAATESRQESGVKVGQPLPAYAGQFDHLELRWAHCQTVLPSPDGYTGTLPSSPPALVEGAQVVAAFLAIACPSQPEEKPSPQARACKSTPAPSNGSIERGHRYIEAAVKGKVEDALEQIQTAPDGQKHYTLRNMALLCGGVLHYGVYSERELADRLYGAIAARADNAEQAETTIAWGLKEGQHQPIDINVPASAHRRRTPESGTSIPPDHSGGDQPGFPKMDDIGMSRWLGEKLRGTWHWLEKRKVWLHWTGTHWPIVPVTTLQAVVKREIEMLPALLPLVPEGEQRTFLSFCGRYLSPKKRDALIDDVKSEDGIALVPEALDRHEDILPVRNGYVNLRTGTLHPHDPALLYSRVVDADYDPTAQAPMWQAFLDLVQPGHEMQTYLQRLAGYAATGVAHQIAAFFYGSGANGKTVFTEVLTGLLDDYATKVDAEDFLVQRLPTKSYDLAAVEGARLVVAPELRSGILAAEQFKRLVDSGTLRIERKYAQPYDIERTHTLILYGNSKPRITDTSNGTWRRLHLVGWNVRIPDDQQIQNYHMRLLQHERVGILAWVVAGATTFFQQGIAAPEQVVQDTQNYRSDEDTVRRFVKDCCQKHAHACLVTSEAYALYCEITDIPLKRSSFVAELAKHCGEESVRRVHGKNTRVFVGWGLRDIDETLDPEPEPEPASAAERTSGEGGHPHCYKNPGAIVSHPDEQNDTLLPTLQENHKNAHEENDVENFTKNPVALVAEDDSADGDGINGGFRSCSSVVADTASYPPPTTPPAPTDRPHYRRSDRAWKQHQEAATLAADIEARTGAPARELHGHTLGQYHDKELFELLKRLREEYARLTEGQQQGRAR